MKFKKIVSAVLASVVAAGVCVANAFAVEDGKATYCFDTDAKISDFVSFGSVEQTGMKLTHNIYESVNGNGCIVVSENSGGDAEDTFGGFYVEASTLGLKNFDSCTIEMSIKLCEGADGFYDNLALFSDGMIWLSQSVPELSTDEWTTVTMQISEGLSVILYISMISWLQIRTVRLLQIWATTKEKRFQQRTLLQQVRIFL